MHDVYPLFLAEVPCINKAVTHARINDYLYEHVSNFTDMSFKLMFERADYKVPWCETAYGDEVLVLLAQPRKVAAFKRIRKRAQQCHAKIDTQRTRVQTFLQRLCKNGKRIAFWGGTGKGASFLNGLALDAKDYPLVVDSDVHKQGFFVPGTGQEIRSPEYLKEEPVDAIVITTQWRAQDIYAEILRREIPFETVYVLLKQKLVAYVGEEI